MRLDDIDRLYEDEGSFAHGFAWGLFGATVVWLLLAAIVGLIA